MRTTPRRFLELALLVSLAWTLGTRVSLASEGEVTVRHIGRLGGVIAPRILRQVALVPFTSRHDSPILLRAETVDLLRDKHRRELKATYQAGYAIVLLDATMRHVRTLHGIVGEGVSYRSKESGVALAYALRRENQIPTATLLTDVHRSSLRTPAGGADPTGLSNDEAALDRAAERAVTELRRAPAVGAPGPRDPNQPIAWQDNPLQTVTFAINGSEGVYNTLINVYALHRCLDGTDHYVVAAEADWTATNAKWQGATSEGPNPSMYLDGNGQLVINWQDNRTYCSSGGAGADFDDVCRYVGYPLSYGLTIVPRNEGTVTQINAAPAATQGQATTYTSGFSFTIGGTVNVSAKGPSGGISAGATWINTTQTTVPPLIVEVGNTGTRA